MNKYSDVSIGDMVLAGGCQLGTSEQLALLLPERNNRGVRSPYGEQDDWALGSRIEAGNSEAAPADAYVRGAGHPRRGDRGRRRHSATTLGDWVALAALTDPSHAKRGAPKFRRWWTQSSPFGGTRMSSGLIFLCALLRSKHKNWGHEHVQSGETTLHSRRSAWSYRRSGR